MAQLEIRGVWDAGIDSAPPELPPHTVHVWQRRLSTDDPSLDACFELLSAEEREKAARYRIEHPRSDYILTRSTLRSLLGQYLGKRPHEIHFRYGSHGKPYLAGNTDLQFNVSHCDGLALLAFVRDREIGVDVEKIRPQDDVKKLAERFFSLNERERLRNLSGDELYSAFFRCWTRKEAYIKATGDGLSLPLHQFDVSIEPDPAQALIATRPDASEAERWTISNLRISPGYAAAAAVAKVTSG
jgi:4'-phosphopantetheinyl transferase